MAYDAGKKHLWVTFRDNQRTYRYPGVNLDSVANLLAAVSRGRYFNRAIKPFASTPTEI
jgi:hypothetical protein